jgi:tetratricopeptide (TPR) repeat protein
MADKIFINYRRDDSSATAGRLHDRLAQAFGRKNLFMDVDHVPAGVDFVDYLHSQVAACNVFLAVIGPNWVDAKDDSGHRRFDNPNDFVTIEIAAALARNIRVVPVLIDGARTPKADKLPDPIKPLVRRNAVEVRNINFGRDAEALIGKVREALNDKPVRIGRWRAAAGVVVALLFLGWIGLFATGVPVSLPWAVQPDTAEQAEKERLAAAQAEEDRKAKAAAEAEARAKAEQAEKERLAAAQAEEDRKAKAAAEAEARAKAEQAEKERLAAAAEEDRKAKAAAEAEARAKAAEAEKQQLPAAQGRGWLGVRTRQVTDGIAERLKISPRRGALIEGVDDNGPAKLAGIEAGDVIVKFDGKDIKDIHELHRVIGDTPVGKETPVVIIRNGEEQTRAVTLGERPEALARSSALVRQGTTDINNRDYDGAIAALSEAIRLDPKSVLAFGNRGTAYMRKGDNDRAIADYDEAIRLDPMYAFAFHQRGAVYARKGDNDRAIADYDEAIRLDYKPALAFLNRGIAYMNKGDNDRAIANYNEAIRLDPMYAPKTQATPGDNEAIRLNPAVPEALHIALAFLKRGIAYARKGDTGRAIADFDEAIRRDAKNAFTFYSRGLTYENKGDHDRAIADYSEAIRLDPNYSAAFNNRGVAYAKKGDNERATADYNKAIRLNSLNVFAFNNRGNTYERKGDHDRAIADYSEAIRLDPSYAVAFNNRGGAYANKGDNKRAIADYSEAIRLKPDYARAFCYRGRVKLKIHNASGEGDIAKARALDASICR